MPALGDALNFSKYEGLNFRAHQANPAPSTPVTGQIYYNNVDNTLYWWDGSAWVSARGGASATPPATTGALGTIQLAGDLAGTAASPQIAAGVITDAEVAAANKDGADATVSMRTLGYTAGKAMPGGARLDQIATPTGQVSFGFQRLFQLGDPVGSSDAANKGYVDGVAQGLTWKQPVRVVATTPIGGGGAVGGGQTIDGVVLSGNDRVLLTAQTSPQFNGLYSVNTGGTWGRVFDANSSAELVGAAVFVTEGTANSDTGWVCTTNGPITVDTTPLAWVQFSGAGQIVAGYGLTKTVNTIEVGAGPGMQISLDAVGIMNQGITNAMIADFTINPNTKLSASVSVGNGGTGATNASNARANLGAPGVYSLAVHGAGTTIAIPQATHALGAGQGKVVQVVDVATGNVEIPDINIAANGDVTVTFGASVAANSKRVTILSY